MTNLEVGHQIRMKVDPKRRGLVRHLIDENTIRVMWDVKVDGERNTLENPENFEVYIRVGRHCVWGTASPTVISKYF